MESREEDSKRGRFDICADILSVLDSGTGCRRSAIAIESNLDSRALSQYLGLLLKYRLASRTRNAEQFVITDKGRTYLNVYSRVVELLE